MFKRTSKKNCLFRRATLCLLCILFVMGNIIVSHAEAGDSASEPIMISTAEQLQGLNNYLGELGENKYFKLANDIDLTEYLSESGAGYNEGKGWSPIGHLPSEENDAVNPITSSFGGHFDGGGHKIKGLWINAANTQETTVLNGLFGIAHGTAYSELLMVQLKN